MQNSALFTAFTPVCDLSRADLIRALDWQIRMGVDCFVADDPVDGFSVYADKLAQRQAVGSVPSPVPPVGAVPSVPPSQTAPVQNLGTFQAVQSAIGLCQNITDLDALHKTITEFDGCAYSRTASRTITHIGTLSAPKILIILNAPDGDLDRGADFWQTPRGALVGRMMDAIKIPREQVCVTHSVFWRPPSDSTPRAGDVAMCQPFVLKQIELIAPQTVLCFGNTPLHSVLHAPQSANPPKVAIAKVRGQWQTGVWHGAGDGTIMPTLSLESLAKNPTQKRLVWNDLLTLHGALQGDSA